MRAITSISLRRSVLEAAKRVAQKENRTFSGQVERWLEDRLSEEPSIRITSVRKTGNKRKGAAK